MQQHHGSFFSNDSEIQASPEEVLGHLLYSERMLQSVSKEQVSDLFKISVHTIEDIELGNFDSAPGRVFIIGFIRSYSKFLNLDLSELLSVAAEGIQADLPSEEMFLSAPFYKKSAPSKNLFFAGLAAVCALWGAKLFIFNEKPSDPIQYAEVEPISSSDEAIHLEGNTQSDEMVAQKFSIEFADECWLSVKNKDGEVIRQSLQHKGDILDFDIQSAQTADFGNAPAVQVKYAGDTYLLQHDNAVVQHNIPLDIENLLKICYKAQ